MIRHFCTLFDSKYLPQGLALYESLHQHSAEPFKLWILAVDLETWQVLMRLDLRNAEVIPIETFVHEMALRDIRNSRTHQEWCWTLASQLSEYLIRHGLREVSYLDADTFIFSDPEIVFHEIGARSIAITPHRLIPTKRYLEVNGLYNVGFVHFKDTKAGMQCVSQWAAQCRAWCFNRLEDDKFGDQKYLDAWPPRYGPECCVIENIGVNAGPWSIGNWQVTAGPCLDGIPIVCYHAHEFDATQGRLTNYDLRPEDRDYIYAPYLRAYQYAKERLEAIYLQSY